MSHDVTDFQREVLERSRSVPVLVDFWAAWCGPCRVLGPVLERLAAEAAGRWVLAKVDTEALPDVAQRYGVMSIPNVKLFVDGEVADEFVGALPEAQVRRWLEEVIPSPQATEVADAAVMIERGAFAEAATALRPVLAAEPGNREARLLLGRALLHADPTAVAEVVRDLADDDERADQAEAIEVLARVAAAADHPEALPQSPAKERFLAGARAVRTGDWAAALEAFIEVLRRQRDYADGAARDAGRSIFVLLGIQHPVAERYHRAFSSALHV
jgi:putative thioredoxin